VKKTLVVALLVCAAWPAAAVADPVSGQDRANAARACKQLQAEMGATFATTYRNLGACASKWTQEAHQNRHQAKQACASEPRRGGKFARCVAAELRAESSSDVRQTLGSAKTCKAQRKADAASFSASYGGGRNAFGKCVSKLASAKDALTTP
jgi:hypothetical protein